MAFRMRLYLDGALASEAWLNEDDVNAVAEHATFCRGLVEAGALKGWRYLYEAYHPDMPEDERYIRWGTDVNGMVDPVPVPVEELTSALRRKLNHEDLRSYGPDA